jgi:hypothetical protein
MVYRCRVDLAVREREVIECGYDCLSQFFSLFLFV